MGSAGHAFIAHTKANSPKPQSKDGGYGLPPHPLELRPGQRFWPREARRRRPFVIRTVRKDSVQGVRLDEEGEAVRVTTARLLETREDGQGRHYQFQGFASRRYKTFACVCAITDTEVILCVPEWHPRRPVRMFLSLVPEQAREVGTWLSLRADLSQPSPARLEPSDLVPVEDPGPARMHRPDLDAIERRAIPA